MCPHASNPTALRIPPTRLVGLVAVLVALALPAGAQQTPASSATTDAAPSESPDPFYRSLQRSGRDAALRGDYADARRHLRLACFGLLDHPGDLAACLVELSLADAALGDDAAVVESFRRLDEVEQRFGAYSSAPLSDDQRQRYEEMLLARLPTGSLETAGSFGDLAKRKEQERIRTLPERQRREALEALAAQDPDNLDWRRQLADLEMDRGSWSSAIAHLDVILAAQPGDDQAHCERGYALSGQKRFVAALEDLEVCSRSTHQRGYALARADALVEAGRPSDALSFLASLPPELTADREAERLERRANKAQRQLEKAAARQAPPPLPDTQEPAVADGTPAEPPAEEATELPADLSAEDRAALELIRESMAEARLEQDLEEPLARATEVADRVPGSAEAQHLVATLAYRASRWDLAAEYFRRGGDPGDEQPLLLFFMAVAFFETGAADEAASALERSLPQIQRTEFVDRYAEKILGI